MRRGAQGILFVCFYVDMIPAVFSWEPLNGLPPYLMLAVSIAGACPIVVTLALAENATADYTIVTSVESGRGFEHIVNKAPPRGGGAPRPVPRSLRLRAPTSLARVVTPFPRAPRW